MPAIIKWKEKSPNPKLEANIAWEKSKVKSQILLSKEIKPTIKKMRRIFFKDAIEGKLIYWSKNIKWK